MTRAVIFDLWDTLVDFDPVAGRAFQDEVAARLGRAPQAGNDGVHRIAAVEDRVVDHDEPREMRP